MSFSYEGMDITEAEFRRLPDATALGYAVQRGARKWRTTLGRNGEVVGEFASVEEAVAAAEAHREKELAALKDRLDALGKEGIRVFSVRMSWCWHDGKVESNPFSDPESAVRAAENHVELKKSWARHKEEDQVEGARIPSRFLGVDLDSLCEQDPTAEEAVAAARAFVRSFSWTPSNLLFYGAGDAKLRLAGWIAESSARAGHNSRYATGVEVVRAMRAPDVRGGPKQDLLSADPLVVDLSGFREDDLQSQLLMALVAPDVVGLVQERHNGQRSTVIVIDCDPQDLKSFTWPECKAVAV